MNIETNELLQRLRQEEWQRHEQKRLEEDERHANEVKLIDALRATFREWELQAENSMPANSVPSAQEPQEEPAPVQRRRGRPPGVKTVKVPEAKKQPDKSGNNGYKAVRERIARGSGVNVAAEARLWIDQHGDKPFDMDEIVAAIHAKNPTRGAATIKSRMFPFFQHLDEKGQLEVRGDKRNHTYVRTAAFDPNPKKHGVTASATPTAISEKERAWRELRGGIATTQPPADG